MGFSTRRNAEGRIRRFNRKMKNEKDLETDSGEAAMALEYLPWKKYYYAGDFVRSVFDVLLTHGTKNV